MLNLHWLGGVAIAMAVGMVVTAGGAARAAEAAKRVVLTANQGAMTGIVKVPEHPDWTFHLGVPETISCREGYADGNRQLPMLLNFPEVAGKLEWTGPDEAGAVRSEWTKEGLLRYSAKLTPGEDFVDVEMTVYNLSASLWHDVFAFNCLNPMMTKAFSDWKLERTYMSVNGRPMLLSGAPRVNKGTMPTVQFFLSEQMPWGGEPAFVRMFSATSPIRTDNSWIVTLSEPAGFYMAATTPDTLFMFDNMDRCCIHAAPTFGDIGPGESSTTVCRFYFAAGTLDDFLARYRKDLVQLAGQQKWARPQRPRIKLAPVAAKGQYGPLRLTIAAPWMDGTIELRLPETMHSSLGLHFIDHARRDMPPLSTIEPFPQWKTDPATGELTYFARTREGLDFFARARPYEEEVYIEMGARNRSSKDICNVVPQICLSMTDSKDFGKPRDLSDLYGWMNGAFTSLSQTTPTPQDKGRDPWVQVRVGFEPEYKGPMEWKDGWWVVDQIADFPVIARVSADKKHLLATAYEKALMISSNTRIPCLHSAARSVNALKPGGEVFWRGKIYLMANDPAALLLRHQGDSGAWPYPESARVGR